MSGWRRIAFVVGLAALTCAAGCGGGTTRLEAPDEGDTSATHSREREPDFAAERDGRGRTAAAEVDDVGPEPSAERQNPPAAARERTDWDAIARAAHAFEYRGQPREETGPGWVRLLAPLTLRPPAACRHPVPRGIPRVYAARPTVGPNPLYPQPVVARVVRAAPGIDACADGCDESTDVFELSVAADGAVSAVAHRARVGGSDARSACLERVLLQLRLPQPRVAPTMLVVPIRLRAPAGT